MFWKYTKTGEEKVLMSMLGGNLQLKRNHYGAKVLCSKNVPMLDCDHKDWLQTLHKVHALMGPVQHSLYRTYKGHRLIIYGQHTKPSEANSLLHICDDAEYIRLCLEYEDYRSRLTPKPWRAEHESGLKLLHECITTKLTAEQINVRYYHLRNQH